MMLPTKKYIHIKKINPAHAKSSRGWFSHIQLSFVWTYLQHFIATVGLVTNSSKPIPRRPPFCMKSEESEWYQWIYIYLYDDILYRYNCGYMILTMMIHISYYIIFTHVINSGWSWWSYASPLSPVFFFHRLPGRADDRQRIGIRRGDIFAGFAGGCFPRLYHHQIVKPLIRW